MRKLLASVISIFIFFLLFREIFEVSSSEKFELSFFLEPKNFSIFALLLLTVVLSIILRAIRWTILMGSLAPAKTLTMIAYALVPITYPIHYYQMRKLDKKLEDERRELERIKERNKLRT